WHEPESIGFKGRLAVTNFSFRGEAVSGFQAGFDFTNRFLLLTNAQVQRGNERLSAASLGIDFRTQKIFLADGFSTADPQAVARAIGPKIGRTIEPYHFSQPPTARVHGIIPIHNEANADMHFEISGAPLQRTNIHIT